MSSDTTLYADFLTDTSHRVLGDTFTIGLKNVRDRFNSDISDDAEGHLWIYDSSDTAVVSNATMELSGTTSMTAEYVLRTGVSFPITASGTYKAVYQIALPDLTSRQWQQWIEIKAKPY